MYTCAAGWKPLVSSSVPALTKALDDFEAWLPAFRPADAVARAREFSPQHFRAEIEAAVAEGFAALLARLSPKKRPVVALGEQPAAFMLHVEQA